MRAAHIIGTAILLSLSVASIAQESSAPPMDPEHTNAKIEKEIWTLLDKPDKPFVSLPAPDFLSLGEGFEIPDAGASITALAMAAPDGAFDPRDLEKIAPEKLGYKAEWVVERYKHYNMDWDITGLKLTSNNPTAKNYPWFVIINGGAANFYEFYVDLKNRPGWAAFLAQKINVMIVSIPGNFKYGGWPLPIQDENRQPQYLLDKDLPMAEIHLRNALVNNQVVMQGLKQIIMENTTGDILISGHSTSGELAMLSYMDPELSARLKGRYFGWGSGGTARLALLQPLLYPEPDDENAVPEKRRPLEQLSRRDVKAYSRGYSWFLNPLYEPGMSLEDIAGTWLQAEARRRPQFKQQIQDLEHGSGYGEKGYVELEIKRLLKETGNPWKLDVEDVQSELMSTYFARITGFDKMVWTTAHMDRNHWVPESPLKSEEVFVAEQFRLANPDATVRVINWDAEMTHYGHLELPRQKAAADYSVIRWLVNDE